MSNSVLGQLRVFFTADAELDPAVGSPLNHNFCSQRTYLLVDADGWLPKSGQAELRRDKVSACA